MPTVSAEYDVYRMAPLVSMAEMPQRRRVVLIVDDDADVVVELADLLASEELTVAGYTDVGAAQQRIETDIDVLGVFVDLLMDGVDGLQFVKRVRQGARSELPIVVVTGWDDPATLDAVRAHGVEAVLMKPVARCEMRRALSAILRHAPSAHVTRGLPDACHSALADQGEADARATSYDPPHEIEVARQARLDFLRQINHELRTPLNAVIGFASLLANRDMVLSFDQVREYGSYIASGGEELLRKIEAIVELAATPPDEATEPRQACPIAAIVDQAIELVTQDAARREASIHRIIDHPGQFVMGHPKGLVQALSYVLDNALKFARDQPRITVAVVTRGPWAHVTIHDNGIGMAPNDVAVAFETFERGGGSSVGQTPGLGVGLPVARRLIERDGGSIRLDSKLGHGTTVGISLPTVPGVDPA